jgi:outer membrane protein assembly factor BamB
VLIRSLARTFALLLSLAAVAAAAQSAAAEPAWTTYHHDPARSGYEPEGGSPLAPALTWHTADLGAPIWSQPLILGSRAYVATVGDKVFALDLASGAVAWEASVGTPVPASKLPCGDIVPTVGIVGTPVIDPSAGALYAVADTWDGTSPHHELLALSLATGQVLRRTPVDPPGADPRALLQRTASNLDGGNVIFGFGGNAGDCSEYRGAVVAAPESGGGASWWEAPVSEPSKAGGAVWATAGPAVGPEGNIYATTGNPVPPSGQAPGPYDYTDSVVQLNASLQVLGSFEPPNWLQEGENDLDLSSAGAELLPGGLLFQAGKDGRGYLIDESTMAGKPGAGAVYEATVCGGNGSFGGDAFAAGTIYIPCTGGMQALAYDQSARTFTPLWRGPADASGPPIVSAGLVWVATGGSGTKLYGLDPASGQPHYTLTLPSPIADHFASPSAAGGMLLLATGSSVTAYRIGTGPPPAAGSASPQPGALPSPAGSSASLLPALLHHRLLADRRGHIRVALRCVAGAGHCTGTVTLRARLSRITRVRHKRVVHVRYVTLGRVRFDHAAGSFALTVKLGRSARRLLRRHHGHLSLQVVIAAPAGPSHRVSATLSAKR